MKLRDKILISLTDEWETSAALHQRIGVGWSPVTIRTICHELTAQNLIEKRLVPIPNRTDGMLRAEFRRKSAPPQSPN